MRYNEERYSTWSRTDQKILDGLMAYIFDKRNNVDQSNDGLCHRDISENTHREPERAE